MTRILFASSLLMTLATTAVGQETEVTAEQTEEAAQQVEQAEAPMPKKSESTLEACRDGDDNDHDEHVDCDDQDCEIYAMCIKKSEPETEEDSEAQATPPKENTEKKDEIVHRPFSLGFVPGLTTDGGAEGRVRNNFSLNFIGWGDYLSGADLSYIGGIRKFDVNGFQGAGIFNYTNGEFNGVQASGITDITHGAFTGLQGSGIASVTGGEFKGFQGAGIASVTGGDFKGFQGAGIASVTGGDFKGFQGAGIANYAKSIKGVQVSGIANVASGEVHGLQAGLINYGTRVRGTQIGLINIAAKEMKGAPIGLINYAGDGILAPTIWGSDNSAVNIGLKMGSKYVYGILGWGIHPVPGEERDSLISGLGGHIDFDPLWLEIDLLNHWLHREFKWGEGETDMIHKLRVTVGYRVVDQLSLFVGPTLNLLISEVRDDADLIPSFAHYEDDDLTVKLSLGFIAGLQWEPKWGALNSR